MGEGWVLLSITDSNRKSKLKDRRETTTCAAICLPLLSLWRLLVGSQDEPSAQTVDLQAFHGAHTVNTSIQLWRTPTMRGRGSKLGTLLDGTSIEIVEVSQHGARICGRIEALEGWMSLSNAITGQRWARMVVPVDLGRRNSLTLPEVYTTTAVVQLSRTSGQRGSNIARLAK